MLSKLRREAVLRRLRSFFSTEVNRRTLRNTARFWFQPWTLSVLFLLAVGVGVLRERLGMLAQNVYEHARYFEGFAIDGTFQILNPLRRLADGQVPGVDFQFFHGLGTLMVHYPLFAWFGGDLFASELSRNIVSPLFFFVSAAILLQVATRRWVVTLVGVAILLVLFPLMSVIMISSGSLLGVRSTMPLLVGASLIHLHRQALGTWRYAMSKLLTLTLLALTFVMSVEHGLAAIGAYILMEFVFAKGSWLSRGLVAVRDGAAVVMITLFTFVLISGPKFLDAILYAVRDIPGDQFWYFGVPPSTYVQSVRDLTKNEALMTYVFLAVLLLVVFARIRRSELAAEKRAFIYLLVYGLVTPVALLGINSTTYIQPLVRIILLSLICLTAWWFVWKFPDRKSQAVPLFGFSMVFWLMCLMIQAPSNFTGLPNPSLYDPKLTQGAHLGPRWQDYHRIMQETVPREATLWSTYTSLAEAEAKKFNPSGYDYIIHALGPERRAEYVQKLVEQKPDYVNTIRRRYSAYEEWLELEHWKWYEQVLLNYDYRRSTPFSHLWQRREGEWRNPEQLPWLNTLANPGNGVHLKGLPEDLPDGSIVTVEVEYRAWSRWGWIPLVGRLPRFFVEGHDTGNHFPVSLSPYERTWRFPVVTRKGHVPRLDFYIASPVPGGRLEVKAVRYRVMGLDDLTRRALTDPQPKSPPKSMLAERDAYEPNINEDEFTINDTVKGSAEARQAETTAEKKAGEQQAEGQSSNPGGETGGE